jgi:cyclopropane fatty-acyl-phospholipid synthase-like methyltransferase
MPPEWFETFFSPLLFDFWTAAVPAEATAAEVDFIVRMLEVSPPARLLDLPVGAGRHALALAHRGYRVTGLDLSSSALSLARDEARRQGVVVDFSSGDMRSPPPGGPYDGAYCFGNSICYLSHEDTQAFIANIFQALISGARWIIDTGTAAESLLPHLVAERTLEAGGVTYSVRNRYDAAARRLFQSCVLARGDERQVADISYSVYTVQELCELLRRVGWQVIGTFGTLDSVPFAPGDRRLLLVAQRP